MLPTSATHPSGVRRGHSGAEGEQPGRRGGARPGPALAAFALGGFYTLCWLFLVPLVPQVWPRPPFLSACTSRQGCRVLPVRAGPSHAPPRPPWARGQSGPGARWRGAVSQGQRPCRDLRLPPAYPKGPVRQGGRGVGSGEGGGREPQTPAFLCTVPGEPHGAQTLKSAGMALGHRGPHKTRRRDTEVGPTAEFVESLRVGTTAAPSWGDTELRGTCRKGRHQAFPCDEGKNPLHSEDASNTSTWK